MNKFKYSIIQRNKSRGIKTWYARIYNRITKEIKFVSLRTTKKSEASIILAEKISTGNFENIENEELTFKIAIDKFLQKCEYNGLSNHSMITYITALKCFKPIYNNSIKETPPQVVYEYFNSFLENASTATYNLRKIICSSMYNFIINDLDLQIKNPFKKLRSKKIIPVKRKSFWTLEQIEQILDNSETPAHRIFYALMAYAGLRYFEAKKLAKDDIRENKIFVIGKGNKIAFIPICEKLKTEIENYNGDYDFKKVCNIHTFKECVKKSGNYDDASCGFHRLRHSFGSNLIRAGANIKAVQLLMRHSNIQTTLNIYSHMLDEDLVASINLLKETKK